MPGFSYPLSAQQLAVWNLLEEAPSNAALHLPVALQFTGRLDVEAASSAIDQLIERHEALQMVFQNSPNGVRQHLGEEALPEPLLPMNLCDLPEEERQTEVNWLLIDRCEEAFDPDFGPMVRTALFQLDQGVPRPNRRNLSSFAKRNCYSQSIPAKMASKSIGLPLSRNA